MKQLLLLAALIPMAAFSQVKTTVANGDFYNPLSWDCTCFPADGDSLVINHALTMNVDIYYTYGRITINNSGSLIEDATDRAFWADGTASLVNGGTFTSTMFLMSPGASMTNTGNFASVDSVWNQGYIMSMGTASMQAVLNDQTGTFHNHGTMTVGGDMNNQGYFHMLGGATLEIGNDLSNCNLQSMDAWFENHGIVCVTNDFSNCPGDTLAGSGDYFIGGSSANTGVFTGTFTFHTPSGTMGIPGTIDPGVTVTTGSCNLAIEEEAAEPFRIYPNPTQGHLKLTVNDVAYMLYDCTGKIVKQGYVTNSQIEMEGLKKGLYLLNVDGYGTSRVIKR